MPDRNAAAQRVLANAKAFRDLGYKVLLLGLSKDENNRNPSTYEGFDYLNIKYPTTFLEWLKYLTSIHQFNNYLKLNPSIIIAYNYPSIALNKLNNWGKKKGVKIISDSTEWYQAKGNFIFRIIKNADTYYRMKYVHLKLDGLIAISEYLFNYYSNKMQNVVKIPPLVDVKMNKWNSLNSLENSNNKNIKLVYAGSPGTGNKDRLDIILKLLSEIFIENTSINFTFTIIGLTKKQLSSSFKVDVPENIKDKIIFKGRLSHINALNEIKKADYNLFLRDDNLVNKAGFPTKLVESITCGTPVLTNSTSNIKDYIDVGKSGFILDISTDNSLKESLINVLKLPKEKVNNMKAYSRNLNLFDYRNYLDQFRSLVIK